MTLRRLYPLILLLGTPQLLICQATPWQRLTEIAFLERNAHPDAATAESKNLLQTPGLTAAEEGKAWNLLGLAYDDEGKASEYQHAYERALALLQSAEDRAAIFDDLGGLYHQNGKDDSAEIFRRKALDLYLQAADHSGIAIANNNLAAIALARHQLRKGEQYLKAAKAEAKLAPSIDLDDQAAMLSLEAYLDGTRGNIGEAIAKYQGALSLWREAYGNNHPSVVWGKALLAAAYDQAGHTQQAVSEVREALAMLGESPGRNSQRYVMAELTYSRILDHAGAREDAMRICGEAKSEADELSQTQCFGCTISAAAFR